MLDVRGIILHFRGVAALSDVSFHVAPRTIHAIIGPNGAGKTSLLNCISGVYRPQHGSIHFGGQDISRLTPSATSARRFVPGGGASRIAVKRRSAASRPCTAECLMPRAVCMDFVG